MEFGQQQIGKDDSYRDSYRCDPNRNGYFTNTAEISCERGAQKTKPVKKGDNA
jgi:hypothetical protein